MASLKIGENTLEWSGDYRVLQEGGESFLDFLGEQSLDAQAEAQMRVYESQTSQYAVQLQRDAEHVRHFVTAHVSGRVKNKEALLSRFMRRQRIDPSATVLELGCNDGRFVNALSAIHGCRGIGIDLSQAAIRRAIRCRPSGCRTEFHVAQAARLPLGSSSIRCVISFDVFEHLGHQGVREAMKECARVLEPRGTLLAYVVSRKDRFTLHETFRTISEGRVGVDTGEGHVYENFLLPEEYRAMAQESGLKVTRVLPYHGFWTLFAEETLGNRLPQWSYPPLHLLDFPLIRHGHGNGFLAVAEKP